MITDEYLAKQAQNGSKEAYETLLNRYKGLACKKCESFFIENASKEDVIQEGMIGLFFAIRDFDDEKSDSFAAFASVCIRNRLVTVVKQTTRKKQVLGKNCISLNKPINDDNITLEETLLADEPGPEEKFLQTEKNKSMHQKLDSALSPLEKKVADSYLSGNSYEEISKELDIPIKSVDNAMQRIKLKLKT